MAKSKKSASSSWAKDNGLSGVVAYYSPAEKKELRRKAFEANLSVREFLRRAGLVTQPDQVTEKDSDSR